MTRSRVELISPRLHGRLAGPAYHARVALESLPVMLFTAHWMRGIRIPERLAVACWERRLQLAGAWRDRKSRITRCWRIASPTSFVRWPVR
jgi:hypothetical protein